jgi:hypothetical protein
MKNLFGVPFWVCDDFLSDRTYQKLVGDIHLDLLNDYQNPGVNCSCKTSIHQEHNINYPLNEIGEEYKKFTLELGLTEHSYEIHAFWWNFYEQNTGQELHTHLGSIERRNEFAGVIFLDGCEETDLIFMNPSSQNLYFIDKQFYRKTEEQSFYFEQWVYQPKNNQLIIFPCTLQHYVSTHKCLEPRMTIAFNIRIETK